MMRPACLTRLHLPPGLLLVGLFLSFSASSHGAPATLAVVKYAKGSLMITSGDPPAEIAMAPVGLIAQNSAIRSGDDGKAVLRLLPDQAFMEIRPKSAFSFRRVKIKGQRVRRARLERGEIVFGLKKKSDPVRCENALTQATASSGRFSCRSDEKGAAMFLVQEGELTVYNRPKDLTAIVRSGQKAVSDLNGIRVSDATGPELEQVGFRQNTLEVDFVNPQTEEFTTLEVEYETNF